MHKKKHILEIEIKIDESSKVKVTQEKKISIKQVGKKNLKISVFISSFIDKPLSDIQAFLINTNIIISTLYLF